MCVAYMYLLCKYFGLRRATSRLGSGQFGSVRKGVWKPPTLDKVHDVALKTLVHTHSDSGEDRIKLLQEAVVMGQFSHPNVIKLLGVAISDDVVLTRVM